MVLRMVKDNVLLTLKKKYYSKEIIDFFCKQDFIELEKESKLNWFIKMNVKTIDLLIMLYIIHIDDLYVNDLVEYN